MTTEEVRGRGLRVGDVVAHPRGGKLIQVVAIVEVPEMNSRMLWWEEVGRGESYPVGVDEVVRRERRVT